MENEMAEETRASEERAPPRLWWTKRVALWLTALALVLGTVRARTRPMVRRFAHEMAMRVAVARSKGVPHSGQMRSVELSVGSWLKRIESSEPRSIESMTAMIQCSDDSMIQSLRQIVEHSIGGDVELVVVVGVRAGVDLGADRCDLIRAHISARLERREKVAGASELDLVASARRLGRAVGDGLLDRL